MYIVQDNIDKDLVVVTTVFNPIRYKSRAKNYHRFARMVVDAGATLVTIEAAFGEREYALDHCAPGTPAAPGAGKFGTPHQYIQVRCQDELWLKENVWNIASTRLPETAHYIAAMDADVEPIRPNWVGETIHQLQHFPVVQMFSEAHDVGPENQLLKAHLSFAECWRQGLPLPAFGDGGYYYYSGAGNGGRNLWHPGFAWAYRRSTLDQVGGLIDFAVLGSADRHMATAFVQRVLDSAPAGIHGRYREKLLEWQFRARGLDLGVVSGALLHYWHGRKADRGYKDRWKILVERSFNPDTDLTRNIQGVWHWCDRGTSRSAGLRDDVRKYFRSRNEDTIEV